MFWIILSILVTSTSIICFKKHKDWTDDWDTGGWIILIVGSFTTIIVSGAMISTGVSEYPKLCKEYQEIKNYRRRINDIKNSYYPGFNKNSIISGSIENIKQSTNLSDYISIVASYEAKYYSHLVEAKAYKETLPLKIFSNGLFISDRIYQLPTE